MSRNRPGSTSYAMPDAARLRPRGAVTLPRELWAELDAEAERRGIPRAQVVEEAALAYLPASRGLPQKST